MRALARSKNLFLSFAILLLVFALGPDARAQENPFDGGWHLWVIPYLWAPRIDGTLSFTTDTDVTPIVSVTPINYLDNLNVPIMLTAIVRNGPWSIVSDLVFVDFSGEKAEVRSVGGPGGIVEVPVDVGSTVDLRGTIWTLGGGFTAWRTRQVIFDIVGGMRYFRVKAALDWRLSGGPGLLPQSGSHSETDDLWYAIIGIRGRVRLGSTSWFAPYYVDIGSGSADLTWMAWGGIGYAFGWGDVRLVYRDLVFDSNDEILVDRLRLTGPAVGIGILF